jgi:trk system potassium uptake protein TrkA
MLRRSARAVGKQGTCSVRGVHFVIMGCGRVGATLARSLQHRGHSVAVIDQNTDAFRRLGAGFEGTTVTGVGFDRDTLTQADTESAYAFAAVSSGDNSNILAARVARETFGVSNVVARIYDPRRAEVYQRLGIPTVATVSWASDQMLRRLLPHGAAPEFTDASGTVQMAEYPVSTSWVGRRLVDLEEQTGARVAFVTRLGKAMLPTARTVYQEGDVVHLLAPVDAVPELERRLTRPPATD